MELPADAVSDEATGEMEVVAASSDDSLEASANDGQDNDQATRMIPIVEVEPPVASNETETVMMDLVELEAKPSPTRPRPRATPAATARKRVPSGKLLRTRVNRFADRDAGSRGQHSEPVQPQSTVRDGADKRRRPRRPDK